MDEIMVSQEPEVGKWYVRLDYNDCKTLIREKLQNMATSFMAAGYYIRYVRDNQLYHEDGYKSIHEFAADQFGMSPQQVNHCMRINERFSKDGYTPIPQETYRKFSKSQLQEMLYLTDEQLTDVTPDMTVKEIRKMKKPLDVERREPEEASEVLADDEEPEIQRDEVLADDGSGVGDSDQEERMPEETDSVPKEVESVIEEDCCEPIDIPEVEVSDSKISVKTVLWEERDKLDQWLKAFEGEDDIPVFIEKQKIIVGALACIVCDLNDGGVKECQAARNLFR